MVSRTGAGQRYVGWMRSYSCQSRVQEVAFVKGTIRARYVLRRRWPVTPVAYRPIREPLVREDRALSPICASKRDGHTYTADGCDSAFRVARFQPC